MLKIGLTGGIGCGKTVVAALFATYGTPIIDADAIAHALVEPGQPALQQLRCCFGAEIIASDGALNRAALRKLAFSDAEIKRQLENILHPLVYREMQRRLDALTDGAYVILSIPLLLETGMQRFVDRIAVVDCPENIQIERVKKRSGLSENLVKAIMRAQVTRQQRLAAANDIIDNAGSVTELAQQIEKLHNLYLTLGTS
ncbi:MAG: dephospho-CoA kinase [Gammaproteobacteria bacterium]